MADNSSLPNCAMMTMAEYVAARMAQISSYSQKAIEAVDQSAKEMLQQGFRLEYLVERNKVLESNCYALARHFEAARKILIDAYGTDYADAKISAEIEALPEIKEIRNE